MSDDVSDPVEDPNAGMIPRRVLMPIGMWTEILDLARKGGGDHRDVTLQLLDLGLQAQDVGRLRPRFVQLEGTVLDRIGAYAASVKLSEEEAAVRLIDLGIQSRLAQIKAELPPDPPKGTPIRFTVNDQLVLSTNAYTVPAGGEVVSVNGKHYTVHQRAWTATAAGVVAHVRLTPYA